MLLAAFSFVALTKVAGASPVFAPDIFSDGMVLQRNTPVPIWGSSAPDEQVTVTFNGQEKHAFSDGTGQWKVHLDAMSEGGPYELTISSDSETRVIQDVLIGEVWLASGQSNMSLSRVKANVLAQYRSQVRGITKVGWSDRPGLIAFQFALDLSNALGVPVGVINNSRRGSRIRSWFPDWAVNDPNPQVGAIAAAWLPPWGENYEQRMGPYAGYGIRGVAWWQGETDLASASEHRHILPAFVRALRADWGAGNFPFIAVQTPTGRGLQLGDAAKPLPSTPDGDAPAAVLRNAFITMLGEPNTGMVVTHDLDGGTHPPKPARPAYAQRLADVALAEVYGQTFIYSGPVFSSAVLEGTQVRVRFRSNTTGGLYAPGGAPLQGFALSADGESYVWADAVIDGNDVIVLSDQVPTPTSIRYGFGTRPAWANLFNTSGLAAAPFEAPVTPAP
jgi:sialate O-acetylesterase